MLLTDMRAKFLAHTSGLADDMDAGAVDAYLNDMYLNFLPMEVDGKIHETIWTGALVANVNPIVIPDRIFSFPTGLFWIQGTAGVQTGSLFKLSYFEHHSEFISRHSNYLDATNTGQPTAVYITGKSLYFDKFPDTTYNLVAEAIGAQLGAIPTAGLAHNHAMAVVTAASWNYLLEQEDEVAVAREATQYETWRSRLLRQSHGNYHQRVPNRSF